MALRAPTASVVDTLAERALPPVPTAYSSTAPAMNHAPPVSFQHYSPPDHISPTSPRGAPVGLAHHSPASSTTLELTPTSPVPRRSILKQSDERYKQRVQPTWHSSLAEPGSTSGMSTDELQISVYTEVDVPDMETNRGDQSPVFGARL
jgi:hypothetical protein